MKLRLPLFLVLLIALSGCETMHSYEKAEYRDVSSRLKQAGLPEIESNNPAAAGALNILPGFGNIYLKQWGLFVCNLLLWPVSAVWGIPQAAIDANTMNELETIYHYTRGQGKEQLEAKENKVSQN